MNADKTDKLVDELKDALDNWEPYITSLNYNFDQSGNITEPASFDNGNYWRADRTITGQIAISNSDYINWREEAYKIAKYETATGFTLLEMIKQQGGGNLV